MYMDHGGIEKKLQFIWIKETVFQEHQRRDPSEEDPGPGGAQQEPARRSLQGESTIFQYFLMLNGFYNSIISSVRP